MDFDKINLLLDVFHKSLNVPNTENIRAAVMAKLTELNSPGSVTNKPVAVNQEELVFEGARRV